MCQILDKIKDLDPNDSDAVKDALAAFFQNLSKHIQSDCNRWLRVLENILTRYPKYCSSHRSAIEQYITHFLNSYNYYNVVEAAKCAHALQQVRPSQDKAATAKNCWREQMSILCQTAHTLIETIFTNTVNVYKNNNKTNKQDTPLLGNTPLTKALFGLHKIIEKDDQADKKTLLCTRLRNVFVFIQAMLVEIYPVVKPIQPQPILEVIVQALSVSSSINSDVSQASVVKTQALRTLDAMTACLGPNLIPFSALVFRFVMQTLRWSSENRNEESSSNNELSLCHCQSIGKCELLKVRCGAYASMVKWLGTLHTHRPSDARGRSWEDELTKHIVDDITPPKHVVQLTMSKLPTKNLSKKAKRKLANTMLQQSNIASHMPGEKNKISVSEEISDEVTKAALECAESFFTVCGIFLKPSTHKTFQERLVRECYNVDGYRPERGERLLRALDACRKNCAATVPPPSQYCLQLYSTLLHSPYDEIRKFCSQALLDIRLHLHCSPPSLNFALEQLPEKRKVEDKRKRISEKNRAVLESLLGKERMPSETNQDNEVITIPDEPSNKKARFEEDIADKISVSSESISSVEISDDSDVEESVIEECDVVIEHVPEKGSGKIDIEPHIVEENNSNVEVNDISNVTTQVTVELDENVGDNPETDISEQQKATTETNIYDAKTQVPLNASNDTTEEGDKSPVSMEVAYDYPNISNNVPILDKMDDENLPSTNDTDDVQITCGQDVKCSQELDTGNNKTSEVVPITNGIVEPGEKILQNGDVYEENETNEEVKSSVKEVTVDDMLADFVDEVNNDNNIQA